MNSTRLIGAGWLRLAAVTAAVLGLLSAVPVSAATHGRSVATQSSARSLLAESRMRPGTITGFRFHTVSSGRWSNSPSASDLSGYTFGNNDPIVLGCYEYGGPAGPYGNTLWYTAGDSSGVNGWINDHYLNTPGTAAHPQPQTPECERAGRGNPFGYTHNYRAVGSARWSNSPSASDLSGYTFGNNDPIGLQCWEYGGPAGPYHNTLWYWAQDTSNKTYGWISDHNLSTPGTAAQPKPQGGECDPAEKL